MAKSRNFVFVLVWLSLLISAGIHLFSKGFLLTRVAQTNVSTCINYDQYRCESDGKNGSTQKSECSGAEKVSSILRDVDIAAGICFPPKARVILLVIDALRYDFGLYNPDNTHPAAYENNLPIMSELLRKHPDHSRRLKFVADPPTTTMQRLKGITTGSLPTFIDIGSNFASPEINEDNLIDQLVRANRTTVFLGDSTWTELFPNRFTREYPHPSFNIYDLDTVDSAIEKQLPREMGRTDWDLIVAHFLGVDHCGHRYGPSHDEMRRKLREMNDVIRNVTERMADGTTLLVIGDHGMTKTGDHGGETEDEVESLLFAYSKGSPLLTRGYDGHADTMQQIDLVPTLATMLGVPIPYSNLGQIMFQLLPDARVDTFLRYQLALVHLWQNARQVQSYFQQYGEPRPTDAVALDPDQEQELDDEENMFLMLTQRVNSVYTEAAFQSFSGDLRHYLKGILEGYRRVWVKFDPQLISHGLLITFLGCFAMALLIVNSSPHQLAAMFTEGTTSYAFLLVFFAAQTGYAFHEVFGLSSAQHGVILFGSIASVALLALLAMRHWVSITENMAGWKRSANVLTRASFVFTTCVFFANSFIVQEQKILSYVLMGFFLTTLYKLHRLGGRFAFPRLKLIALRKSTLVKLVALTLFALVLIRVSGGYFRCREEQANCTDHLVKVPSATSPTEGHRKRGSYADIDVVPCVALVLYIVCARKYLRACGNLTGTSLNVLLARYGPTVAVVCTCAHFTVSKTSVQSAIPQLHVDALAWIVYGLLLVQIGALIGTPLLLYVLPKRTDVLNVLYAERGNVAPEIYRQLKENYRGRSTDDAASSEIPIVCGLGTAYSSVFISAGALLTVTLALLLGSHGTMGLILVNSVAVAYGIIASILQYEQSSTRLTACIQPSFPTLLTWIILQQYGFFATAHQPTLSQIDWNAAFIGRTYHFDGSHILSGLLVLLNTFSVTFLLSVLFPLLVFVPFCVYTMWPTLAQRLTITPKTPVAGPTTSSPLKTTRAAKGENTLRKTTSEGGSVEYRSVTVNKVEESTDGTIVADFDITKGELNLYENEKLFLGTVFKTGCQLILLQSLRIFCAMFACTLHCRHLMVWKIFAPRFIYEGIASYVMFVGVILGFLLLLRVHRAVGTLITAINKRR
ncbi:GPI ethanolamine phosphate transferase 3 [Anopheles funestus]|uniref:GPI ethanolamine phosphate transferase 3 n=1 Tax=Anopheles funestus TaxID=62324 RepID=UPI0020C64355|nr:GPI ethanolamine phosphate transferase 3 [Anopheles funestus]XP_049292867.1 GPI ethanolamine phosphate transferase 3 [Anopheles funestus]